MVLSYYRLKSGAIQFGKCQVFIVHLYCINGVYWLWHPIQLSEQCEHPYMLKTEKVGKMAKSQKLAIRQIRKWQIVKKKKMAKNFVLAESISRSWLKGIAKQIRGKLK